MREILGEKKIRINEKFIRFTEPIRFIEEYTDSFPEVIVILYLQGGRDVSLEPRNNISAYNKNGELIWTMKDLIKKSDYCSKYNIKDTLFFSIKKLDFNILYAYDFNYHFYINVNSGKIIDVMAHR